MQGLLQQPWVVGPAVFLLCIVILLILKRVVYGQILRWAQKHERRFAQTLLSALHVPLIGSIMVIALVLLAGVVPLPTRWDYLYGKVLQVAFIGLVFIFLDSLIVQISMGYDQQFRMIRTSQGIVRFMIHLIVLTLGALIVLAVLEIPITPLVATLGLGSLAIALALQPTLSNFFSGIHILLDRPIEVGHFVRLETGEEGYVEDIGWRSTRIRLLWNNIVIVPNTKLIDSTITNYHLPAQEMSLLVQVGIHYNSDLEHVERVTCEVAREVLQRIPGGVREFDPYIRYHTFGDFSIDFTVILRIREFVNSYLIRHEFIKALHKRYKEEGIVIPFPIRTLDVPHPIPAIVNAAAVE
jgi:small-conductance mechanosensitive channel